MNKNITKSDSILKKRIRRFKSIKRGYYSFIILTSSYILSFFSPILVNSKALMVCYSNQAYNEDESFSDANKNGVWDQGESFNDEKKYYFPALSDLFGGLFSNQYYDASFFGQDSIKRKVRFGKPNYRILDKTFKVKRDKLLLSDSLWEDDYNDLPPKKPGQGSFMWRQMWIFNEKVSKDIRPDSIVLKS